MKATKALAGVLIGLVIVVALLFAFFPDYRPAFVENLFRWGRGYTAAKSPQEALDKFQKLMDARDYQTVDVYVGGDYAQELRLVAKEASGLALAIDDLVYNIEEVANIKSDRCNVVLKQVIDPFPKGFKVVSVEHKEGEPTATAILSWPIIDVKPGFKLADELSGYEPKIFTSIYPYPLFSAGVNVPIRLKQESDKSWKIYFVDGSLSPVVRDKIQYLKQYHGNYRRAIENVKFALKHDAATKDGLDHQLKTQLEKAK